MSVILPFRAFRASRPAIYVPGEEAPQPLRAAGLVQDAEPALFHYRQRFRFPHEEAECVRDGVMGLLHRAEATVFRHEETLPDRVADCVRAMQLGHTDPGSLWLWCNDAEAALAALLPVTEAPHIEVLDRFGCLYQWWPITGIRRIRDLQAALDGKALFLADGHHRFAAGWNLATIQIRSAALRSLASHRLVMHAGNARLPQTRPIENIEGYLACAPAGHSRYIAVTPGAAFGGFELPCEVPLQRLLPGAIFEPIRDVARAVAAVQSGQAPMALLVAPFPIEHIEQQARRGLLLPPKSTDFYPKLAAGVVMHRRHSHPRDNGQKRVNKKLDVGETSDLHAPSAYVT